MYFFVVCSCFVWILPNTRPCGPVYYCCPLRQKLWLNFNDKSDEKAGCSEAQRSLNEFLVAIYPSQNERRGRKGINLIADVI